MSEAERRPPWTPEFKLRVMMAALLLRKEAWPDGAIVDVARQLSAGCSIFEDRKEVADLLEALRLALTGGRNGEL